MSQEQKILMDIRIRVVKIGGTENIQYFRRESSGEEFYIGTSNFTPYEREILALITENIVLSDVGLKNDKQ